MVATQERSRPTALARSSAVSCHHFAAGRGRAGTLVGQGLDRLVEAVEGLEGLAVAAQGAADDGELDVHVGERAVQAGQPLAVLAELQQRRPQATVIGRRGHDVLHGNASPPSAGGSGGKGSAGPSASEPAHSVVSGGWTTSGSGCRCIFSRARAIARRSEAAAAAAAAPRALLYRRSFQTILSEAMTGARPLRRTRACRPGRRLIISGSMTACRLCRPSWPCSRNAAVPVSLDAACRVSSSVMPGR